MPRLAACTRKPLRKGIVQIICMFIMALCTVFRWSLVLEQRTVPLCSIGRVKVDDLQQQS